MLTETQQELHHKINKLNKKNMWFATKRARFFYYELRYVTRIDYLLWDKIEERVKLRDSLAYELVRTLSFRSK